MKVVSVANSQVQINLCTLQLNVSAVERNTLKGSGHRNSC